MPGPRYPSPVARWAGEAAYEPTKKGAHQAPYLITKPGLLRRLLCHPALVPGGSIGVNESLAGGAIEELHRGELFRRIGFGRMRFLQCGSERRALGAIARHRCAGLTHILFCGRNIRHSESPEVSRVGGNL